MSSNSSSRPPITLTIAGFDPTGGAGLLADIKTFAALDCYGLAVTTAITVQDSGKVYDVLPVSAQLVGAQLETLFKDFSIAAVKIGMLADADIALTVADLLAQYRPGFIVLDPLILSSSGYPLATPATEQVVREKLFPIANVITPNLPEAAAICQQQVYDILTMHQAASKLTQMGAKSVLIKGGHLVDSVTDLFFDGQYYHQLLGPRLSHGAHGTGCALSSAIAAYLAHGSDILTAITQAKKYLTKILEQSHILGEHEYLLNHFAGKKDQ